MASYSTGRTITVQRGVRFIVDIGTEHGVQPFAPGGFPIPIETKGVVRLRQVTAGSSADLSASGSGEIIYTQTYEEICDVTADQITYSWQTLSSSRSVSGVSNPSSVETNPPSTIFRMPIYRVEAFCPALSSSSLYEYVSGSCYATCAIEWVFNVNGTAIDIPSYGLTAFGAGASASQSYCEAFAMVGSTITARSARFSQLTLSGSPGTYQILSEIGQAYKPRFDVDLQIENSFSDGSSILASEFTALTLPNVSVLFDRFSGNVAAEIPRADVEGRRLSGGEDQAYVLVFKGTESITALNANLNGSYGSGNHWFKFSFQQSLMTAGAVPISNTTNESHNFRATSGLFNAGIDLYTALTDVESGFTASIFSIDSKTITGTWTTVGTSLTFIPASHYQICGYRWLNVVFTSATGGTVTVGTETRTIPAGGSTTFTIDRFGDSACLLTPPTSLPVPQVNALINSGSVTGGAVTGTHTAPEGYGEISGASVYFSRTNALPVGDEYEGLPHTLGMLCLFSGGCPALRLDNMNISDLLSFFVNNPAAGMSLQLATGSLTPTAGTREAAHLANGLNLSCLNSGLPFFTQITSSATVKKLCRSYSAVIFPRFCGDVIGGSVGDMQTIPVRFKRVCPIAFFYTLMDGLEDSYTMTVRDSPGIVSPVNLNGTIMADSFGFMITGNEVAKSKNINPETGQVNVMASEEIQQISSSHTGAFFPPLGGA